MLRNLHEFGFWSCVPPPHHYCSRARISKRLKSPQIDSKELIPPAYVAWRAGFSNRVVLQAGNRFLGSLKGLQIRAPVCSPIPASCVPWRHLLHPVLEFVNNLLGDRNQIEIGFSYQPARQHRLAEWIPCNRFLDSVYAPRRWES